MGPGVECWGANPRRLLLVRAQSRWRAFMLVPTEQNMFLSTSFFGCWCPTDIFTGFNVMFLQCHLLSFNYRPLKGQPGFMKAQFHSRESKARGGIEPSTFTSGRGACAPPNQRSISFIEHDSNPGVKLGRHKKKTCYFEVFYTSVTWVEEIVKTLISNPVWHQQWTLNRLLKKTSQKHLFWLFSGSLWTDIFKISLAWKGT